MPLRPVSELGLVDLTDLALRDDREANQAGDATSKAVRPRPRKRSSGATPRQPAKTQGNVSSTKSAKGETAADNGKASRTPKRARASAARPPKQSKPSSARSRQTTAATKPRNSRSTKQSRRKTSDGESQGQHRRRRDASRRSNRAKLGATVLTSVVALAGGALVGRMIVQR